MNTLHTQSLQLGGKTLTLSTGKLARQSTVTIHATWGETTLLAIVTIGKTRDDIDYFPLSVESLYNMKKESELIFSTNGREGELSLSTHQFQDQLLASWHTLHPEIERTTNEERNILKTEQIERDRIIAETDIPEFLKKNQIEKKVEKEGSWWKINIEQKIEHITIPEGYAAKGGLARSLLARNLNIDNTAKPRDIDLVRVIEWNNTDTSDDQVAATYMQEDYQHGHGVEIISSLGEYFATRDFTINEVLATNDTIWTTTQCLQDTVRHIIRITEFEMRIIEEGKRGKEDKMMAKSVAFLSEGIEKYGTAWKVSDQEKEWDTQQYFISLFWIALQLDRAFEKGENIAERFVEELKKRQQLSDTIETAEQAARPACRQLRRRLLRPSPALML
jgi:hypothetical protein